MASSCRSTRPTANRGVPSSPPERPSCSFRHSCRLCPPSLGLAHHRQPPAPNPPEPLTRRPAAWMATCLRGRDRPRRFCSAFYHPARPRARTSPVASRPARRHHFHHHPHLPRIPFRQPPLLRPQNANICTLGT